MVSVNMYVYETISAIVFAVFCGAVIHFQVYMAAGIALEWLEVMIIRLKNVM